MDNPVSGTTLIGTNKCVWLVLDENGVAKIDVLVDGKAAGQAIYGDVRLDVQKAYPQYNNGKSGFHFPLDSTKFSNENILLQLGKLERMAVSRHYQQ